jgi:hypothetical protein
MPAPSTPEPQNLHREAQVLIEQATVQQAESSASRICQQGSAGRRWCAGPRGVSSRGWRDGTTYQLGPNAGQGANP